MKPRFLDPSKVSFISQLREEVLQASLVIDGCCVIISFNSADEYDQLAQSIEEFYSVQEINDEDYCDV